MTRRTTGARLGGVLLTLAMCAALLSACIRTDAVMVALLLPTAEAERWQRVDEPVFRERVESACTGCEVVTYAADGDPDRQAEQFREALRAGADAVVIAAVDSAAAEDLVEGARVPVVAYDRFVLGADYVVSHDTAAIGALQAQAVVDALEGSGRLLMVNGGTNDPGAAAIKQAANEVLRDTDIEIVDQLDPPTWGSESARAWVAARLADGGADSFDAIYAANDVQAGGVVAALREAGVRPADFPVITGQDAELAAVQRLVTGEQTMTVYKHLHDQATQAADIAVALLTDNEVEGGLVSNGVAAFLFQPTAVTRDNLADTVVRDGFHAIADICDGAVRRDCVRIGLG